MGCWGRGACSIQDCRGEKDKVAMCMPLCRGGLVICPVRKCICNHIQCLGNMYNVDIILCQLCCPIHMSGCEETEASEVYQVEVVSSHLHWCGCA